MCLVFNIYRKINFMAKIGLIYMYAMSLVNWSFVIFFIKIFLLFFTSFKLFILHNNVVKLSKRLNIFTIGKIENIRFLNQ